MVIVYYRYYQEFFVIKNQSISNSIWLITYYIYNNIYPSEHFKKVVQTLRLAYQIDQKIEVKELAKKANLKV